MMFVELLFALAIALFFTVFFTVLGRRARRWPTVLVFFLVIFLAAWAGGIWITPVGPTFLGIYWISFFSAGLIFTLLLVTVRAFSSRASRDRNDETRQEEDLEITIGVFFWILLLILIVAIIIGYVHLR
jgi:peptidoglycan/LPS O-acetylase OafA/YrhL